jgi:hypothetical protein
MVTGMIGMAIMMGMIGTTIMVMAITGTIGLTAGAMGIATGMMIAVLGLLTEGVMGLVGIRVTERMPPQDTTIRPTNVSIHATAGIHAPIIIMAIRAAGQKLTRYGSIAPAKSRRTKAAIATMATMFGTITATSAARYKFSMGIPSGDSTLVP